ncbi:MAG: hypothetical protein P8N40_11425 [Gammaproteobacteria bacterium]|nr:hypothetical protein [Gammaproteobacteria bacterium]
MIKYFRALLSIKSQRIVCLITSLIWQGVSSGQQLELFEETETSSRVEETARSDRARRDSAGNIVSGPIFTLVGTTRIGESHSVMLRENNGEIISIKSKANTVLSIPGYPGYLVSEIGLARAAIEYPEDLPCIEYIDEGVLCIEPNKAQLGLTNATPLEARNRLDINVNEDRADSSGQSLSGEPQNPFEALLEGGANSDSNEETGSFTPRRINPEDVPPGMRVVSTPFGDRLVEE